jgi:hypothetical protein
LKDYSAAAGACLRTIFASTACRRAAISRP